MGRREEKCHCDMDETDFLKTENPMKIMVFINQMYRKKIEKLVADTGIHRAQHRMLMMLSEAEYDSQAELARALEISTATVTVSLKKLERDGYIQKKAKEEDSRVNFVSLTAKGEEIVKKSKEIFGYLDNQLIKGFADEELITLRRYLSRMYNNLSEIE